MSEFFRQLRQVSLPAYNLAGNTGAQLELAILPEILDGAPTYVRELQLRISGTVTSSGTADTQGNINWSRILSSVLLDIPGVGTLVDNVSGNKLVRLYREENGGEFPPFGATGYGSNPWNVATGNISLGASNTVDLTFPVQWSRPAARRYDDDAVPVALLKRGNLKVNFPALTDLCATITASSLTLTVTAVCYRKHEKKLGNLPVIDSIDIGTSTEPLMKAVAGKILSCLVQPQADGVFGNGTDWSTQVGIGFGDYKITEDTAPVDVFYDRFNALATTDIAKHTSTRTDPTSFIPLVFPPAGKQGQHKTFEAIAAGAVPRIKVNAASATNGYAVVRRRVLDQRSSEMANARSIIGLATNYKHATASKKPNKHPDVEAFVPVKAR